MEVGRPGKTGLPCQDKMRRLRVGLAQINTTVGDFRGNTARIGESIEQARKLDVDLVVFPELATCGYPPEDLIFRTAFVAENLKVLDEVIKQSADISLVLGFVDSDHDLYNAAAIVHDGKLAGVYRKIYLPTYGVFDEDRYFRAGNTCQVYVMGGTSVGITVCEDVWYEAGPAMIEAHAGAEVIVNIGASPYHSGKPAQRERMLASRAADSVAIVVHVNLVGGQDELVFDGGSVIINEVGEVVARGKQFGEDFLVADLDIDAVFRQRLHDPRWRKSRTFLSDRGWHLTRVVLPETVATPKCPVAPVARAPMEALEEVYSALTLGTRDYLVKNGIQKAVIGLSGGIDSSLVAAIAVDAIGRENVIGVSMPSRYSSPGSRVDAALLGANLGIELVTVPIEPVYAAFMETLAAAFAGTPPDVTEENLQARIRGLILMALSNKFGWLVLTTGNKSEMSTGYTTLYGDMAGGFAVIKDVTKTLVYELAAYRNRVAGRDLIPGSVLAKPPSAELRPGQKDSDSLPPYDLLDVILAGYVEEDRGLDDLVRRGLDMTMVRQAIRLVDASEYKRRQAPLGVRITPRALGRERRIPVTNRFKDW